jgi:hypothetical protein
MTATTLSWQLQRRNLTVYAATGIFLGLAGPFGSYFNGAPAIRIAYWMTTSLVSCVFFDLSRHAVKNYVARLPQWIWLPVMLLAANGPLTIFTRSLAIHMWPFLADKVGWLEWYLQLLVVSLIYVTFGLFRQEVQRSDGPMIVSPLPLSTDVFCLQMEDHYVRVHTADGSRLILASLCRAMAGLKGGMQVHRSWWVARDAVEGVIEDGRNIRLKLRNGLEAPVARTKVAQLRAAGWLPQ